MYELALLLQREVCFAAAPGAGRQVVNPHAGLAALVVPADGRYRIRADRAVWIDLIGAGGIMRAASYNGHTRSAGIHKSVDYDLRAGDRLLVQCSQSPFDAVGLAIEQDLPAPPAAG